MAKKKRVFKVKGVEFTIAKFASKYGFKYCTAYEKLVSYENDGNYEQLMAKPVRKTSIVVAGKKLTCEKLMVIHKCKPWRARAIMGSWKRGLITERQALGKDPVSSDILRYSTDSYKDNNDLKPPEIEFSGSLIEFESMTPSQQRAHDCRRTASISRVKVGTWEAKNL